MQRVRQDQKIATPNQTGQLVVGGFSPGIPHPFRQRYKHCTRLQMQPLFIPLKFVLPSLF